MAWENFLFLPIIIYSLWFEATPYDFHSSTNKCYGDLWTFTHCSTLSVGVPRFDSFPFLLGKTNGILKWGGSDCKDFFLIVLSSSPFCVWTGIAQIKSPVPNSSSSFLRCRTGLYSRILSKLITNMIDCYFWCLNFRKQCYNSEVTIWFG